MKAKKPPEKIGAVDGDKTGENAWFFTAFAYTQVGMLLTNSVSNS